MYLHLSILISISYFRHQLHGYSLSSVFASLSCLANISIRSSGNKHSETNQVHWSTDINKKLYRTVVTEVMGIILLNSHLQSARSLRLGNFFIYMKEWCMEKQSIIRCDCETKAELWLHNRNGWSIAFQYFNVFPVIFAHSYNSNTCNFFKLAMSDAHLSVTW